MCIKEVDEIEKARRGQTEGCTEIVAILKNTVGGGVMGQGPGDLQKDRCGETEMGQSL